MEQEQFEIVKVLGREILDSRGNPTVEAEVILKNKVVGRGLAPSGASTGEYEALELRDGDRQRYLGKGVLGAVNHINTTISDKLSGMNVMNSYEIDNAMRKADGTKDKSELGANAILAVSIASVRAASDAFGLPLYRYLGGAGANVMPVPMMNILNGGAHAKNLLDFQEFMIVPVSAKSFGEALRMGTEVYHTFKAVLSEKNLSTAVGDEGGFAPDVSDAYEALDLLTEAINGAGYRPGVDFYFAMDAAASELYQPDSGMYFFPGESKARCKKTEMEKNTFGAQAHMPDTQRCSILRSTKEMIAYYKKLAESYPIISIEDGLDEEDWEGWKELTSELGQKLQLVGDDLFVTNTERLERGIKNHCGNAILIKLNQIGSVSETLNAIKMAQCAGYGAVVSHRSGETEDTTIADLSVALNCGQIKTGAPCRSERVAKYNRLLRIEEELGSTAKYPGLAAFLK